MKNMIVINANKNCICDLLSTVDNGENRFFLEIRADTYKNPKLEISDEQIAIAGSPFLYEVGSTYYLGTGELTFRIVDDAHTGDYFHITKVAEVDGNLFLNQISNFSYELLYVPAHNETGVPIATDISLGVVKGGSNVGIKPDGTMWANEKGIEAITNAELDEICK